MPSHFTLVRISKLIQATADAESQAEMLRQVLCEKPAFETFSAFKRISKFHSKITTQSLYNFLKENSADITKDDAYNLMRLFDTDKDGRICFTEFLDIVLPRTNSTLKERVNSRKSHTHEEDEGLPYQIEHALVRIFEEELQSFKKCQSIRQELSISRDFSVMNSFSEIDIRNRGFIDAEDIIKFFEKINKDLPEPQLASFMQRLDKDGDGRINFNDFLEIFYYKEVDPLQESKTSNSNRASVRLASGSKSSEKAALEEKTSSDKYLDDLRDRYASPTRRNLSPSKKLMLGSNEGFLSPGSTNASSKYNGGESEVKRQEIQQVREMVPRVRFAAVPIEMTESQEKKSERRRSPMKVKDEVELVKAFEEILRYMHGLEDVKNEMAARKDFNLYNAFAVFDMDRKGAIDKKQLAKGLSKLGLDLSKGDIYLIMKAFESASSGVIRFGDFSYMATPRSTEFAKILNTKLAYYATNQGDPLKIFSKETISAIKVFWTTLVKGELLFEALRQRLGESKTFSLQGAFKTLDTKDAGYVTAGQVGKFLEGYGVRVSKEDLNSLVERLTASDDKKVSYLDFVNTMTPRSPEKYSKKAC